ncbi:MAG: DUF1127 domain-containing protein [Burkholderiaceae bacterium]
MNNRNKQYGRVTIGAADIASVARHGSTPASRNEHDAHALRSFAANGFGDASIGRSEPYSLLNSIELEQQARAHRSRWQSQFLNNLARAAADYVRGMRARWERRRRVRATFLALQALDASTLRDLGFHRSEILSVATEINGDIGASRVRFVPLHHSLTS